MNLFKMQTIAKTIDAINTNGYENTIPEFITWLESRENEISSRFYNIDDINELSSILDNILNEKKEEYNTKIKEDLNTKYLKLNYDIYTLISNDDTSIDYNALVKLYSKLENIEIITNKKKDYSDLKDIIETISNLRYLNILDLEYLAIHKKDLFYSNENTNLYYAYNIYEEKEYTEINLTELIDKNIMLSKPEDITSYSNIGYYIASGLISAHHTKYELLASFIRNISFSINNGINYSDWVKAANEEGMEGNDIWEILGIDKNASLDKTALKNINVSDILQNYSKLSSAVKNRLGLTVNILDDGYDTASMLFDPITALLLSKEFVEKGYYIDKNANGDNAIFNSDRIEVNLSFEVDKLIQDIQNKHNSYLGTFSHLFDNHSLNDFLSGINPENMTNIKEILDFINFSYSINPKTGKREVSINFNLGITDINDRILWNNISGGIGNYTSGDPYGIEHIQNFSDITFTDFLELTYHTGANYLNSLSGGVFTYPDVRVRNHFIDAQLNNYFMRKNEAKALKLYAPSAKEFSNMFKNTFDQIKADYKKLEGGDLDDKEIYDIMLGDAKASLLKTQLGLGGLIDLRADSNKKITELNDQINYLNGLITTIKEALSESLKAQKKAQENYNNDSSPENEEKLVKANSAVDGIKESLAVANKEKVDNEKKLKDEQKENDEIAKKQIKARKEVKIQEAIINETKEKIGVPVVNPMCKPDMYSNNECDNGTGPGGDPRILLSRKGGLGVKLIELANQRILNIPFRECNVITRTCSGNNVEVTSEELQLMFKSIADKAGADDGACDWTPINGCSYFDKTGQGKWYYIDLLWDPRPDFDAIVASLPEEISLEQQLELNLDFLLDLEIDLRTNLNERLNIDLEIPEMP
jgi:hypothetical protein